LLLVFVFRWYDQCSSWEFSYFLFMFLWNYNIHWLLFLSNFNNRWIIVFTWWLFILL
jgi:hypothetical protein